MANIFKSPPAFNSDFNYESWKKDIIIWQELTDISKDKQALAIHLVLSGKARQASSELSVEVLKSDDGVKKLLEKLDELFLLDESRRQFSAFQHLYNLKRSSETDIGEFVNEFERSYFRFTQEKMTLPDAVMAFMLLTSCSLSESQFQLVMSSMSMVTYENMKTSLKRIFGGRPESSLRVHVKEEPVFYGDSFDNCQERKMCDQEVYFGRNMKSTGISRGQVRFSRYHRGGRGRGGRHFGNPRDGFVGQNRQLNPLGHDGLPSKCVICESKYHWARNCPHSYERAEDCNSREEVTERETVHLSLLTGYTDKKDEKKLENLLNETYGFAVLDSGCSTTVCGEEWLSNFLGSLSESDKQQVKELPTNTNFTFGDGRSVASSRRIVLPCIVGDVKCSLQTDVVTCGIPLLLSRIAMKRARMCVDFENDTALFKFNGKKIKLSVTSSGHYSLPLSL